MTVRLIKIQRTLRRLSKHFSHMVVRLTLFCFWIFGCHKWCLLDIAKRKYEWSLIYNLNKFSNTHNFVNDYPRILCTTINLKPFSSLCTRALKLVLLNDWIRLSYWISIMYQSYKFWWEHDGQFVHILTYTSKFTLRLH